MVEVWKKIKGFCGYEISDNGDVYDTRNDCYLQIRRKSEPLVYLYRDGKHITVRIKKLIADHFIDNPDNKKYIVHIDEDKMNCSIENLQWASAREMKKHSMRIKVRTFDIDSIESLPNEIWKPIKGYETYIISNLGRIVNKSTSKFIKPSKAQEYYSVNISNLLEDKPTKLFRLHRLVALTFIHNDDPTNKIYIDHINNNKLDNKASNLRWVTPKQNYNAYLKNHKKPVGKTILQYDFDGNLIKKWNTMSELINEHNEYNKFRIYECLSKRREHIYGYIWVYEKERELVVHEDEVFVNLGIIDNKDFSNYEISNYGKVKSYHKKKSIYIKTILNLGGYLFCSLYEPCNEKGTMFLIHRLVAMYFVEGETKLKCIVNHKNGDKTNNHYNNLEWVTYRRNSEHALARKVNKIDIKSGQILATYNSINDASRSINGKLGNTSGIAKCCHEKQKTCKGFIWQFTN